MEQQNLRYFVVWVLGVVPHSPLFVGFALCSVGRLQGFCHLQQRLAIHWYTLSIFSKCLIEQHPLCKYANKGVWTTHTHTHESLSFATLRVCTAGPLDLTPGDCHHIQVGAGMVA
eukprot:687198-Amphidinium_carterae.1